MDKAVRPGNKTGPPQRRRKPTKPTLPSQAEPVPGRRRHRQAEVEWRRENYDLLVPFAGQWVVLEREEIIAYGDHAGEVVEAARRKGVEVPYLFRVEPDYGEHVATIGL